MTQYEDRSYVETMIEFSSITTRGGDSGETSLYSGERRSKDDPLFEALGDLDELNSWLGLIKVSLENGTGKDAGEIMNWIQDRIIVASGEIAAPKISKAYKKLDHITNTDIDELESKQAGMMEHMDMPDCFVHPGFNRLSAETDIARSVCRRCERRVVTLIRRQGLSHLNEIQRYLNRLSDFLYVLARDAARRQ